MILEVVNEYQAYTVVKKRKLTPWREQNILILKTPLNYYYAITIGVYAKSQFHLQSPLFQFSQVENALSDQVTMDTVSNFRSKLLRNGTTNDKPFKSKLLEEADNAVTHRNMPKKEEKINHSPR